MGRRRRRRKRRQCAGSLAGVDERFGKGAWMVVLITRPRRSAAEDLGDHGRLRGTRRRGPSQGRCDDRVGEEVGG